MANYYNPNNPYGYPYINGMPAERQNNYNNPNNTGFQNPLQLKQYAFVNGIEGAKAYPLLPNQMMLLMDADNPVLYKKTSDNLGKSTLEYFVINQATENQIKELITPKQPEYALKSDVDAINNKLDKLLQKFDKSTKQTKESKEE